MDINALVESAGYPMAAVIIAVALLVAAVRMNCTLQLTDWLRWRDERKKESSQKRQVENCRHAWTLYSSSTYSSCNLCRGLIATTRLMAARDAQLPGLQIEGEARRHMIQPKGFLVSDPIGKQ